MEQIKSITGQTLEEVLRDEPDMPATPPDRMSCFDIVPLLITLIQTRYNDVKVLALAAGALDSGSGAEGVALSLDHQEKKWLQLDKPAQLILLNEVIEKEVREFLNYDGGDVDVVDIVNGVEVIVEYSGACGSCSASSGSTMFAIENILRSKVYDGLKVTPRDLF